MKHLPSRKFECQYNISFGVTDTLRVNITLWQCKANTSIHTYVYDLVLQESVGFPSNILRVRFDQITVLTLRTRKDKPEQTQNAASDQGLHSPSNFTHFHR